MADSANLAHIQGITNVFVERLRGLCAGEADSADLAHIERNKVFRAFSRGCVLGWLIQPTWHTFKELSTFLSNVSEGCVLGRLIQPTWHTLKATTFFIHFPKVVCWGG